MGRKAVVKPEVSESSVTTPTKPNPALTPRQHAEAIVAKHTILSTEGQKMFTNEAEIYREMSLSPGEADMFLGGRDPNLYFKEGLIHSSLKGYFGDLLDEDREEVQALKRVIKNIDIPMFKHRRFNQYLMLIPKKYSENELDGNDEFTSKVVHQDYRVVAFTGQHPVPSAFEEAYFMNECKKILINIQAACKPRGIDVV